MVTVPVSRLAPHRDERAVAGDLLGRGVGGRGRSAARGCLSRVGAYYSTRSSVWTIESTDMTFVQSQRQQQQQQQSLLQR